MLRNEPRTPTLSGVTYDLFKAMHARTRCELINPHLLIIHFPRSVAHCHFQKKTVVAHSAFDFFCQEKNLRFTFVILRTIQVDKYWITYCGLSLVDMNCSVLTSVSVDMLIIAELFVKK